MEGFRDFASRDPETKANIDALKASLNGLKLSWGAAFAPIVNAVAPLLQKLISWLTAAGNALNQFFSALSGKTTFKKVSANMESVASGATAAGDAVEEAKKQIMGFDEINRLDDNKSDGGGGGGAGGGLGETEETGFEEGEHLHPEPLPVQLVAHGGVIQGGILHAFRLHQDTTHFRGAPGDGADIRSRTAQRERQTQRGGVRG